MKNIKLSITTLFLLVFLLFFHVKGMEYNLYLTYWFYDIIAHILGGVCIALSLLCVASFLNIEIFKNKPWILVLLTFVAGIAWEAFEVYYNISGYIFGTLAYKLDTAKDLFDDVLGSVLIGFIFRNKK